MSPIALCGRALSRQVVHDVGVREVELAGGRIVAIAFFGDGQGDDPGRWRGKPRLHGVALILQKEHFAHAANDAPAHARGTLFDRRVQTVLRREPVAHLRRAQAHAADAPRAALERQCIVAVNGRLRAMEGTDPQVDDPDID